MRDPISLPDNIRKLLDRVLRSRSAESSKDLRQAAYDHVAALTRNEAPAAQIPADVEPYIRKVALNAYKVLDRDVDAMRAAGYSTDEIFEMTVASSVSAGVTRMEIALAALEERDASAA
jgi:alkylhydroperoxidase family enzyme